MGIHRRQCCCRANNGNDTQEHSAEMVSSVGIIGADQDATKEGKDTIVIVSGREKAIRST